MEMESEAPSSPFKGFDVPKAHIKAELRASHQLLSAHGLMHSAKWAAEQVIGLGDVNDSEVQVRASTAHWHTQASYCDAHACRRELLFLHWH